jgi:hypothetical protein
LILGGTPPFAGGGTEPWIALLECRLPIAISHAHADLSQEMRPAWGALHLLAFAEVLADHLIDRRFHKARAVAFPSAVALAIVWIVTRGMSLRMRSRRQISGLMPCTTSRI